MEVAIQDIQRYAIVAEGAENIANLITQYRIIERIYLKKSYEATPQLKEHLTDLYALILKFFTKAIGLYSSRSVGGCNDHLQPLTLP